MSSSNIQNLLLSAGFVLKMPEPLDFTEARRMRGPIYEVLIRELYEGGCITAAHYFEYFVKKEQTFLTDGVIKQKISDNYDLLIDLFENVKAAELASRSSQCQGKVECIRILSETLKMMEEQAAMDDWLVKESYGVVLCLANKFSQQEDNLRESKARLYFNYGDYVARKGKSGLKPNDHLIQAQDLLTNALELCRGELWLFVEERADRKVRVPTTMHQATAYRLTEVHLLYAKALLSTDPDQAIKLAELAVERLLEVKVHKNSSLLRNAYMEKMKLLVESKQYEAALNEIEQIRGEIKEVIICNFYQLECELRKQAGICYYYLNNHSEALCQFKQGLTISLENHLVEYEPELMVWVGKLLSEQPDKRNIAKKLLEDAKKMFTQQKDYENREKVVLMLAKLNASEILPSLYQTIRNYRNPNDMKKLRDWKNRLKPFWCRDDADHENYVHKSSSKDVQTFLAESCLRTSTKSIVAEADP